MLLMTQKGCPFALSNLGDHVWVYLCYEGWWSTPSSIVSIKPIHVMAYIYLSFQCYHIPNSLEAGSLKGKGSVGTCTIKQGISLI